MKLFNKLLFILPLFSVITSCDDAEPGAPEVNPPEPPVTSFWEVQSHCAMMGWKGNIKAVDEKSYPVSSGTVNDGEDPLASCNWKFDANGHLLYYNPTGIEPEPSTRGVWQTMACYSYEYDESGRLIRAMVDDFSGEPIVYTLTYEDHDIYVPLIFPLGTYEYFLVKGLKSIVSDNGSITYTYEDHKSSYVTESWSGTSTTTFEYNAESVYPVRKTITLSRGDVVLGTEVTSYIYNKDGSLTSTDKIVKEGENEVERTVTRYAESTLVPLSILTDAGGQMDWTYTYNEDNWLMEVSYKEDLNDGIDSKETADYIQIDAVGNWIVAMQQQSNVVDWSHIDGSVRIIRNIEYY